MDLSFKELHGTEVHLSHLRQPELLNSNYAKNGKRIIKRLRWLLVLSAVVYVLSTLSVTTLLVLAGLAAALIALAAAACIYAQNNSPFP
jgi:small-conductance mechanosensitive channel